MSAVMSRVLDKNVYVDGRQRFLKDVKIEE